MASEEEVLDALGHYGSSFCPLEIEALVALVEIMRDPGSSVVQRERASKAIIRAIDDRRLK